MATWTCTRCFTVYAWTYSCPSCDEKYFGPAIDTHKAVNTANETVVVTFPVSGWYQIDDTGKEMYFKAGAQLILNGPYNPTNPSTGTIRLKV